MEDYNKQINKAKNQIYKIHKEVLEKEKKSDEYIINEMVNSFGSGIKKDEKILLFERNYTKMGESDKIEIERIKKIAKDIFGDISGYNVSDEIKENCGGVFIKYGNCLHIYLERTK